MGLTFLRSRFELSLVVPKDRAWFGDASWKLTDRKDSGRATVKTDEG